MNAPTAEPTASPAAAGGGVRIGLCTFPDRDTAIALARTLVDERLAACVNLLPAALSIYRWEGEVEQAEEVLAVIKTTEACLPALMTRPNALHPYDCPELIALDAVAGLPAYLEWVQASCGRTGETG